MYESYNKKEEEEEEEDLERETRKVEHFFGSEVFVWYSPTIEKRDGYGIYQTKCGKLLKGTTHCLEWGNPYPRELKDVEIMGRAVCLKEAVDIPKSKIKKEGKTSYYRKSLPEGLSIENKCMCDLVTLSSLLFEELLSFSGMAHED